MTWIGSEAWIKSVSQNTGLQAVAVGYFGVLPDVEYSQEFYENYLPKLSLDSNKRNVWFPEFVEVVTNCNLNDTCNRSLSVFQ